MSEDSESFHLLGCDRAGATALMLNAGFSGWILGSNHRWATIVPLEEDDDVAFSGGPIVLRWRYHADFGLMLEFMQGGVQLGRVALCCDEEEDAFSTSPGLATELGDTFLVDVIAKLAPIAADDGTFLLERTRDAWAAALQLPVFKWLSRSYCRSESLKSLRLVFPGAEEVGVEAES